ncbi:hypothetical protein KALB_5210 [Kutzneria albida DSM 43870]|uniref:OmpR/PhoB-type domain-containing protein n=2 Tax=Kutzneria TaxID=43356 RepID=W5WCF1_9PSEU|nr:hypothetical protein KALB_5210 [Kutzneria albida DSM 43870]
MEPCFTILGNTGLRMGEEVVTQWGHPKLRGVLAVLLLHPGRLVSIDELIDWVWPEAKAPRDPATTMHTYIKRIREALRPMNMVPKIDVVNGAYRIAVDKQDVDFFVFRDRVEQARVIGRRGNHADACQMVEAALALWTERPLADLQGERAENWRIWARSEPWISAQGALTYGLLALGEFDVALRKLDDLPVEYQVNLTLVKRRLDALYRLRRPKDAKTFYLKMRKFYVSEFDHDEADELTRFHGILIEREKKRNTTTRGKVSERTDLAPQTPHLLPHDIPDFAGREDLLRALDAMVTASTGEPIPQIIVLEGPPGVGKTAVATHWAHHVAERFPGGRLYVDLQGFADLPRVESSDVVERFLAAFDFPVERLPTAMARSSKLANLLSGRRVLVILDNAEDSRHVQSLLECLSTCLVLVTSRQRLSKLARRGASSLTVLPLQPRESIEWLSQRVGQRSLADPESVRDIAALCGGNALSLRVVGEHIAGHPDVPLADFVEELRDERAVLNLGDDGDGPDASIRASLSYSYQKLEVEERRLFRLLGIHPGSEISLAVAAAIAARAPKIVQRSLDILLSAHLVTQVKSRDRYRFHDLLREYAVELAGSPAHEAERLAGEERMLSFYLHTASNADLAIFPHGQPVPMLSVVEAVMPEKFGNYEDATNWFVRERANLSAVVRYAVDHGYYAYALPLPSCVGEIYLRLGYYGDILDSLNLAIHSARITKDALGEAYSINNLGVAYLNLRHFDLAESYLKVAKQKFDEIGLMLGSVIATHHLARLQVERGEYKRGIESHLTVLRDLRSIGAKGQEVIALYRLGEAYRRAHNLAEAISFSRDALWHAERLSDDRGQAFSLAELGAAYAEQGDLTAAKGYCKRGLAISERLNGADLSAKACMTLSQISCHERQFVEAERYARKALDLCVEVRDARGEATAYELLGHALYTQGEREGAVQAWRRALAVFEDLGDPQASSVRVQLAETAASLPAVPPEQAGAPTEDPGSFHLRSSRVGKYSDR